MTAAFIKSNTSGSCCDIYRGATSLCISFMGKRYLSNAAACRRWRGNITLKAESIGTGIFDVWEHNCAILRVMCRFFDGHDRLFAGGRRWSSASQPPKIIAS